MENLYWATRQKYEAAQASMAELGAKMNELAVAGATDAQRNLYEFYRVMYDGLFDYSAILLEMMERFNS